MHSSNLSILIVNYNTKDLTAACLDSIFATTHNLEFEVILWDNASNDGSKTIFEKDDRITYVYSKNNLGFAEANNRALKLANGKYILYLNSDTLCHPKSLESLLAQYKISLSYEPCILAPTLLNSDGSLQKSYFNFPTVLKSLISGLGLHLYASRIVSKLSKKFNFENSYSKQSDVFSADYAILACNLVTAEFAHLVNGLDENFFFYHDDCDFAYQLRKKGIRQKIYKGSQITHIGGGSSSNLNVFRVQQYYTSLLYFYSKNYSYTALLFIKLFFLTLFGIRLVAGFFLLRFSLAVPSPYINHRSHFFLPISSWRSAIYVNLRLLYMAALPLCISKKIDTFFE